MSTSALNPFTQGSKQQRGEQARLAAFIGAITLGDLMRPTLGPKGMDKILMSAGPSGEIRITNDGATILDSIIIDNPAARVLIDISRVQDQEVGDGTTTVCVLAAEMLREAEKLMNANIDPMTIISGYRKATDAACAALEAAARDNSADPEAFRADLMDIARTTLSSKILGNDKEHFARLAVDAVLRLNGSVDTTRIHIIKKQGGGISESYLDPGFILNKRVMMGCPRRVAPAKILVANAAFDNDKIKIANAVVRTSDHASVAAIETAEEERMIAKCQSIIDTGVNVIINRQPIYDLAARFFGRHGVLAVQLADFNGVEQLASVTGATIASTFTDGNILGEAGAVEEVIIGEDRCVRFSDIANVGTACTVVLRGASSHLLDEAERSLHDALCVLSQTVRETRVVEGGGCSEMIMARAVSEAANRCTGKEALAMSAFATALMQIPTIIADNAGLDSSDILANLRAAHAEGDNTHTTGVDVRAGTIGDMKELGIRESYKSKRHSLLAAAEAAEQIVRVDTILQCAARRH